jgi:actin-related protein
MTQENKKQIEQDVIVITATLAGKSATFALRMVSMQEEQQLRQRYSALNDGDQKDRISKEYLINADAITNYLTDGIKTQDPEKKDIEITAEQFFNNKTAWTERVSEFVMRGYLAKLNPEISFK